MRTETKDRHHVMWFDSFGAYVSHAESMGNCYGDIEAGFAVPYGESTAFADVIRLARCGLPVEGVEALNLAEERLQERERALVSQRFETVPSPEGAFVDIAKFLEGDPYNMVAFSIADETRVESIVTLVIAVGVRSDVSTDAYKERGQKVMALVEAIEQTGLQTEIWLDKTAESRSRRGLFERTTGRQAILFKAAGDPYDATALMYALCHVSMHRVLGFNTMHAMPSRFRSALGVGVSYGSSVHDRELPHPEDYPEGAIYIPGLRDNRDAQRFDTDEILRQLNLL